MRTTSNPAFRNLPTGGYTGFNSASGGYAAGYPAQPGYADAPPVTTRPMTVDDVVTKTGIMLAILVGAGAATWISGQWWLAFPAMLVGLVIAIVNIFRAAKGKVSPALSVSYAAVEGVFLGGISAWFETMFPGIVIQAVIGTAMVFAGMLVVYKTGAIRVTPRLTKWVIGALIGAVGLMLVNWIASMFVGGGLGLRDGGPLAIGFSLLMIGLAAFVLLLDFDGIDQAIRAGTPEKWAWYSAFSLVVTLVWLYIEVLRLLSYLQGE